MQKLRRIPSSEINRKLLHGIAIALPVGIFYGPGFFKVQQSMACYIIGGIFLATLLFEGYRLHNQQGQKLFRQWFGRLIRTEENGKLTGATWVLAGSVLCSLLALISPVAAAAAFWGLTLFILGDAAAALVGKAFGRTRIGRKTLEGAMGCYVLCVLLSMFVLPQLPLFIKTWGDQLAIWQILLISGVITLLEFFPIRLGKLTINDNLYVPVLATLAAMLIR
jgi:dolichol kinase